MNNHNKPKFSLAATDIVGLIFAPLGLIFLIVGILVNMNADNRNVHVEGDPRIFLATFGGVGGVFLVLGVAFLVLMIRRRMIHNRLFTQGHYIMAQVTSDMPNYNVRINGCCPYFAECSYTDPNTGILHLFRSRDIYFDPTAIAMDAMVPVYVDPDNFRHYYVDIDSVLPKVQRH